jgi:hypothetical protein
MTSKEPQVIVATRSATTAGSGSSVPFSSGCTVGHMSDGEYAIGNYLTDRLVEAEVDRVFGVPGDYSLEVPVAHIVGSMDVPALLESLARAASTANAARVG